MKNDRVTVEIPYTVAFFYYPLSILGLMLTGFTLTMLADIVETTWVAIILYIVAAAFTLYGLYIGVRMIYEVSKAMREKGDDHED